MVGSTFQEESAAPILPDEAYLAGLREQIEVHEARLKSALALVLDASDMDQAITAKKAEFQSICDASEQLIREQGSIKKMTDTDRATLGKVRADIALAETLLADADKKVREESDRAARLGIELDRQIASKRKELDDIQRNIVEEGVKLADLESRTEDAADSLEGLMEAVELNRELENEKLDAVSDASMRVSAELAKLDAIAREKESLDRQADTIIGEARRRADEIVLSANSEVAEANAQRDRVLDAAQAVSEASRAEIARARDITDAAEARRNAVDTLKRNVLIELSKEMKNAELQKGNERIQDYLKSIQDA